MHQHTDDQLARSLQEGNSEALNVLMERYQKKLARFIYHYTGRQNDVDDLVQDTFVKCYLNIQSFRYESQFSTWLFQIAVNLCKDAARKKGNQTISIDSEMVLAGMALASDDPSPENTIASRHLLQKLDAEIHRLPHKLKTALVAFAIEEQSQEECARLLGVSPKTIETRVYRARKLLAERVFKPIKK